MLTDYFLFLFKFLTLFLGVIVILMIIIGASRSRGRERGGRLNIRSLNEQLKSYREEIQETIDGVILSGRRLKKARKERKKEMLKNQEVMTQTGKRVFVLSFEGDVKVSEMPAIREEITAILSVAQTGDEVVIVFTSGGGQVHEYGLLASQLERIRAQKIYLTVCIDKVAASGGYLVACVANKIVSAPFAIIGSIGVIMQLPNFKRLLDKHEVDFEQLTVGEYKRTLTLFGENTDEAREKTMEELAHVHDLFQQFIAKYRPEIDLPSVSTGETWYGQVAIKKALVDEINTSDSYLTEIAKERSVFHVGYQEAEESIYDRLKYFIKGAVQYLKIVTGYSQKGILLKNKDYNL